MNRRHFLGSIGAICVGALIPNTISSTERGALEPPVLDLCSKDTILVYLNMVIPDKKVLTSTMCISTQRDEFKSFDFYLKREQGALLANLVDYDETGRGYMSMNIFDYRSSCTISIEVALTMNHEIINIPDERSKIRIDVQREFHRQHMTRILKQQTT